MSVRVLLTAGPTREAIDPVRYLSNASTGRQGAEIAREALSRGWDVELVHGPMEVAIPRGVTASPVESAEQMLDACLGLHPGADVVIGAAAVSDYRPVAPLPTKRRRGSAHWLLRLEPTRDILQELGRRKEDRVHVGFALQTDNLLEDAIRKLREKNLDCLVANPAQAIGAGRARYHLLGCEGEVRDLGVLTKRDLARELCDDIARRLRRRIRPGTR